jgi:hypothetical protein
MVNEDLNRVFRKFKPILTLGKNDMLSNYRNYSIPPFIPEDYQLKQLNADKNQRKKYKSKLISLIKLLDKYVKRLYKLFGKK